MTYYSNTFDIDEVIVDNEKMIFLIEFKIDGMDHEEDEYDRKCDEFEEKIHNMGYEITDFSFKESRRYYGKFLFTNISKDEYKEMERKSVEEKWKHQKQQMLASIRVIQEYP